MILSPASMADIRKHSLNQQEQNVIETLDMDITTLREALQWALLRVNYEALDKEPHGEDAYRDAKSLAYPKPTEAK